jgi:hypothetical protein
VGMDMDKSEEEELGCGTDAAWSGGACEALFTGLEAGRQWRDGAIGCGGRSMLLRPLKHEEEEQGAEKAVAEDRGA